MLCNDTFKFSEKWFPILLFWELSLMYYIFLFDCKIDKDEQKIYLKFVKNQFHRLAF